MKVASKLIDNFPHSSLGDLQGGKEGEYYHLTKAEWEKTPTKPHIKSPVNGAENINQVPLILGSDYYHPYNMPMYWKEIQIATDAEFENIVYELPELEKFSANTSFQVPLKSDETSYLEPGTTYYIRIQYKDRAGKCSEWSDTSTFTTMTEFPDSVLLAPQMIIPADGGEARAVAPILAMSRAQVAAGVATFDRADWQISNDPTFETTLYEALGTEHLTIHQADNLTLSSTLGAEFYARGRQWPVGETDETKVPWTPHVWFNIRPDYTDLIFGIRKIFSKRYGVPFVFNIDPKGDVVSIPPSYWNEHPMYASLNEENATNFFLCRYYSRDYYNTMLLVPPCWMKYRVYENNDGDMVIDAWYSPTPQTEDGWRLDMAFTNNPNGFYHGTCLCAGNNGGYIYSAYDAEANQHQDYGQTLENINRSISHDNQLYVWTIYERRLLMDLMIAEYSTYDPSRISVGSGPANNINSFRWRGFRGLLLGTYGASGIALSGIKRTQENNFLTKVQVMMPDGGNWMPYDTSLEIHDDYQVTDILSGYSEEMGFDVALLGIASATGETAGQTTSPWGMKVPVSIVAQYGEEYCMSHMQDGLFGISAYDSDNYGMFRYVRMSRHIV